MANDTSRQRGPLTGALLLIIAGLVFLYANLRPDWNPWPLISRYWPVVLILLGLGKLWDVLRSPGPSGGAPPKRRHTGEFFALLILLVLLAAAFYRGHSSSRIVHQTKSVDLQHATSVRASVDMSAGDLNISGGAAKLLDASFDYSEADGKPEVSYDESGQDGHLTISENDRRPHFARDEQRWQLRMNNDAVHDLKIQMGAGQGTLNLSGIHLKRLDVEIGAGEIIADLTGDWNQDVDVQVQGGVGNARIRLPKNVGVRVRAQGGIGSISVDGLRHDGEYYVNDAYGKSPVTMKVDVQGGIGEIRLVQGT
jgi:N-terminal domain of toast_rack, DUF2154/LiaF transmembrane domain